MIVLVIPGLDGHPGMLAEVAEQLWPARRTLFFDHRQDDAGGGLEGIADRAAAWLDQQVGPQDAVVVCGESFGSLVALVLARRHPRRVAALVLLSGFGWYPWPHRLLARLGLGLWQLLGDRAARLVLQVGRGLGLLLHLGWSPSADVVRTYVRHPFPDLAAYRAKCRLVLEADARPWLGELQCPLLVVSGAFDPVVPASAGRRVALGVPGAVLCRLPGGHVPHLVQPAVAGRQIAAWLEQLVSAPPPQPGPSHPNDAP